MEAARYWLPRALGLFSFLWFAVIAAPTFYWLDSAELTAGAVGLGSPHPSGFPLYMMLAKAASFLPVGDLAFRVNLLSAVCGACAVGGVSRLVLVLGREDWATIAGAAGAGGVVCFSLLFARQATIADVYAPTAALIVLTISLFERVASGGNARAGLSLAWASGLGFAVHPEFRMLMGLPIVALLCLRAYRGARWPLLAPGLAMFGAMGSYLYLPVRSATGRIAALDWGHPNTLGGAWSHATGAHVQGAAEDHSMSMTRELVSHDVSTFVGQILDYVGILAVLAGLIGMVILIVERRTRWIGVAIGMIVVLDVLYASWIHPIGLTNLHNGVPLGLALSICAGVAIATLARSAGAAAPYLGAVAAIAMIVPQALMSAAAFPSSGELPREYSESVLYTAPVGALVLSQSRSLSGGAVYLQTVEGARPDVGWLVAPRLTDVRRVAHVLGSTTRGPVVDANESTVFAQWKLGRPVLWEPGTTSLPPDAALHYGAQLPQDVAESRPRAFVGRLVDAGQGTAPSATALATLGHLFGSSKAQDPAARWVLATSLSHLGAAALAHSEDARAEAFLRTALDLRPGDAGALETLGVVYSRSGHVKAAAKVSEQALESEPNRPVALVNAARYRLALGDLESAARHAKRALAVAPKFADSWTIAGRIDVASGNRDRGRSRLQAALAIEPGHREAQQALTAIEDGR